MLQIQNISFRLGGRALFERATLSIQEGQKIGLVGRNGTGKTTLLRLIQGDITPDNGSIEMSPRTIIGTVAQEAPAGQASLLDTVLAADTERESLLRESETATDPARIADIHTRLADMDAHSAPARAAAILSGLGFDEDAQHRPCGDYSGGWRMRVALAATLFMRPTLLLLDEPTNHLDLEAVLWLESHLAKWQGSILLVSHERGLLNRAVKEIVHLENTKLTRYTGGYDDFERIRREKLSQQSKLHTRQMAERKRIQAFIDRFRYKPTKARQAQSRIKLLEKMEPIASVIEESTLSFEFPQPDPLSPPLIALENISAGYEDVTVLRDLNMRIDMDDRIALLGANGNGKSTLIKLLADKLSPQSGKLIKSRKLKIGYFAQHQTEELRPDITAYDHLNTLFPMAQESRLRAQLGRFGFVQSKADTKVSDLSGGEKARLLFCLMSSGHPHLMLLDEPTNHLDVDARGALVEALNMYNGAIILVSHDPHLIRLVADRLWIIDQGTCLPYDDDLDAYERSLLDARKGRRGRQSSDRSAGKNSKKEQRQQRAAARAELAPLRKKSKEAEKRINDLSRKIADIEARLADPDLYANGGEDLASLQETLGGTKKERADLEYSWLEIQENLENLTSNQ